MRTIRNLDPEIYNKSYYIEHSKGFKQIFSKINPYLNIKKDIKVLDLGCGSGNLAIMLASKGAYVTAIDYSQDAIKMAKSNLEHQSERIKKRIILKKMDMHKMNFEYNHFDYVICIDVFEHIYKEELENIMDKISRTLKKGGTLFVHTEANKIYLDFTHRFFIYPASYILIYFNKIVTGKFYPNLPRDPRNELHKIQHVNEPTYFYLSSLFKRHGFRGKIISLLLYKPLISWKDLIYNCLVHLYPISLFPPFNWLFSYDYICVMKNIK